MSRRNQAPPVDDDPGDVEGEGNGDEAGAESDEEIHRPPAPRDTHIRRNLRLSIAATCNAPYNQGARGTSIPRRRYLVCATLFSQRVFLLLKAWHRGRRSENIEKRGVLH